MLVDVVLLPADLRPHHLTGRAVAVFDVLRATTTMTAALAAGVREIRVFPDVASARAAAAAHADVATRLLCGETNCLAPEGFDLGNSPRDLDPARHAGRTVYMSTTNGTRAILAAGPAPVRFAAAVVNASAVAAALAATGRDVTLLCAGTGGEVAMEDVLGCGAVIAGLQDLGRTDLAGDTARIAARLFAASRDRLRQTMADSTGGRNVIGAKLDGDIDFAARPDAVPVVGVIEGAEPVVRAWTPHAR
ncbi:MAG TPA: 2-phosphosulfolactate phosphatase [Humisphaera sp.]